MKTWKVISNFEKKIGHDIFCKIKLVHHIGRYLVEFVNLDFGINKLWSLPFRMLQNLNISTKDSYIKYYYFFKSMKKYELKYVYDLRLCQEQIRYWWRLQYPSSQINRWFEKYLPCPHHTLSMQLGIYLYSSKYDVFRFWLTL